MNLPVERTLSTPIQKTVIFSLQHRGMIRRVRAERWSGDWRLTRLQVANIDHIPFKEVPLKYLIQLEFELPRFVELGEQVTLRFEGSGVGDVYLEYYDVTKAGT